MTTESLSLMLGVAGVVVGVVSFCVSCFLVWLVNNTTMGFINQHMRPLFNQINAISEKVGVGGKLRMSEDGTSTRIVQLRIDGLTLNAAFYPVDVISTPNDNNQPK